MIFAESDHNRSQRQYENACREAHAADPDARAQLKKSVEDKLVEGGMEAVNAYREMLNKEWEKASCLAEFDGLSMSFAVALRAEKRINSATNNNLE